MVKGSTRSRTMWIAVVTGMIGAAVAAMPMIEDHISKEIYGFSLMALSIVFAGLRIVTTQPLEEL